MTPTRVTRVLGEVDDLVVARILDTGATVEDLEEAVATIVRGEEEGEEVPAHPNPRVAEIHEIVADFLADEWDPQEPAS